MCSLPCSSTAAHCLREDSAGQADRPPHRYRGQKLNSLYSLLVSIHSFCGETDREERCEEGMEEGGFRNASLHNITVSRFTPSFTNLPNYEIPFNQLSVFVLSIVTYLQELLLI